MGALTSRQNADVEETDVGAGHAYKYPPKSGNYFGSHFIMGGERFDTPQPEAYLFGENADLNFLGNRPTAFPYPPPLSLEPTKTLRSLVNIRKESVRFVKVPDLETTKEADAEQCTGYNVEFIYDADAKFALTIYYFCTEEVTSTGQWYATREPALTSTTFHCESGVNKLFSQPSHVFYPNLYPDDDLYYNAERDVFPVAIHCVVEDVVADSRQSHTTICVIDQHLDGTHVLRALKQKMFVDGLCYLLQEIYGIENKNLNKAAIDDDTEDNGSECVICMCDTRDTLILPCRHLCLCNSCADSLRYQANNCPICRAPFRALLQIKAVKKKSSVVAAIAPPTVVSPPSVSPPSPQTEADNIPSGFVGVSLIEALNGPPQVTVRDPPKLDEATDVHASQAAEHLNRSKENQCASSESSDSATTTAKDNQAEINMKVLKSKSEPDTTKSSSDKNVRSTKIAAQPPQKQQQQQRDSLKIVNEKATAAVDQSAENDDDSDAEKLSPLLEKRQTHASKISERIAAQSKAKELINKKICDDDLKTLAKNIDSDSTATVGLTTTTTGSVASADDSDYYTPEDPHTTILSPLCPENPTTSNNNKTSSDTQKSTDYLPTIPAAVKDNFRSLPDSPVSGSSNISTRSSGDSYSSGSSTRQLLSVPNNNGAASSSVGKESGHLANDAMEMTVTSKKSAADLAAMN